MLIYNIFKYRGHWKYQLLLFWETLRFFFSRDAQSYHSKRNLGAGTLTAPWKTWAGLTIHKARRRPRQVDKYLTRIVIGYPKLMLSPTIAELRPYIFYFLYNCPKYQVNWGGALFLLRLGPTLSGMDNVRNQEGA